MERPKSRAEIILLKALNYTENEGRPKRSSALKAEVITKRMVNPSVKGKENKPRPRASALLSKAKVKRWLEFQDSSNGKLPINFFM